jgi:hypothetical protein
MSPMRSKNTASVAAVYDRRKSTEMPPQDKPVRCSGGLRPLNENESGAHRAPLQENEPGSIVAAYERREQNDTGSHRQPLQKARLRRLDRVFVDLPIYFLTACIEALVAFANAQGGSVLVGVSDAGHSLGVMIFALSCL